jgi:thiol-disulfide isomerase/thioredoxin
VRGAQWAALAGVGLLLAGALVGRDRSEAADAAAAGRPSGPTSAQARPDLDALRAAADLAPCPPGLGPELPDLVLPCLGGGPDVDLRAAPPGRPTLVNVWATWCPPCVDEVPELVDLAARGGDRLSVVGVLTQDPARNGLEFSRQFAVRYPSLLDEQGELRYAVSNTVPVTLFLDAGGTVVHTKRGPFADRAEVDGLVREHLGVDLAAVPDTPGDPAAELEPAA